MELSPQSVASTTFRTVKKGYDPDEVRAYLAQLATAIEGTQSQAAAMEARARAAVARLQEIAAQPAPVAPSSAIVAPAAAVEESETISRTLLLAQRTADTTIAEAEAAAVHIREDAESEARYALDSARETQTRLIEEAKVEARKAGEGQRIQIESEVQALLARREFLLSDVDHLEQHVITHRERLREVAGALTDLVDNANGGLTDLRRPLMSAVIDTEPFDTDPFDADPFDTERFDAEAADAAGSDPDATMAMDRVDAPTSFAPDLHATPQPATQRSGGLADGGTPGDSTPAFGGELPFDDVTTEVPQVHRRPNDAFDIGGTGI